MMPTKRIKKLIEKPFEPEDIRKDIRS